MKFTMTSLIVIAGIASILSSCKEPQYGLLKRENDSLHREIQTRKQIIMTLNEAERILDSIEISYDSKKDVNQSITSRLIAVRDHIKDSHRKLSNLEEELTETRYEANIHLMMLDALKGDLNISVANVEVMEDTLGTEVSRNNKLEQHLSVQEQSLRDLKEDIVRKHEQLNLLEQDVVVLEQGLGVSSAEMAYAKAQRTELVGRRMLLAPQKKHETMKEALELYKKAYTLGKKEAKERITYLENML